MLLALVKYSQQNDSLIIIVQNVKFNSHETRQCITGLCLFAFVCICQRALLIYVTYCQGKESSQGQLVIIDADYHLRDDGWLCSLWITSLHQTPSLPAQPLLQEL